MSESGSSRLVRLLPVLIIVSMIGPLALNILMPSMPGLAKALDASRFEVQLTLSLFLASQAVSQLFIGGLADRFGRRPVLLASLTLFVAASVVASLATSILFLVLARIVQAAGATAGLTLSRTIVRDLAPRDQAASMIGYVTMGMVVAPLIAPALGGFIDDTFGWRMIFWACAALGASALIMTIFKLPETLPVEVIGQSTHMMLIRSAQVVKNRQFLGYAGGAALTSAAFFAFLGAAPYLIVEGMGMQKTTYGLWFIALSIGYMIGNYCSGRYSQRFGIDRMIRIGLVFALFGTGLLLTLALVPILHPGAIFLPCFFMSVGNGFSLPNAVAGAVSVDAKAAGAASGVTGFLQMGIGAIFSFIAGQFTGASPVPMAIIMFALAIAAFACVEWGRRARLRA